MKQKINFEFTNKSSDKLVQDNFFHTYAQSS